MKVLMEWGTRNLKGRYSIKAGKYAEVKKFLESRPDRQGLYLGVIHQGSILFRTDNSGNVISIKLRPSYSLKMPSWPAYRTQSRDIKERWDAYWRGLEKHELGHHDIFMKGMDRVLTTLEAQELVKKGEIKQKLEEFKTSLQKEHDDYDTRTDHGRNTIPPL